MHHFSFLEFSRFKKFQTYHPDIAHMDDGVVFPGNGYSKIQFSKSQIRRKIYLKMELNHIKFKKINKIHEFAGT